MIIKVKWSSTKKYYFGNMLRIEFQYVWELYQAFKITFICILFKINEMLFRSINFNFQLNTLQHSNLLVSEFLFIFIKKNL